MILHPQLRQQLKPSTLNWVILNNLHEFDNKPEQLQTIYDMITKIKNHAGVQGVTHPVLTFWDYYYICLYEYYPAHKKFPDVKWLQMTFKEKPITIEEDTYSSYIYDDLIKYLEQAYLKLEVETRLIEANDIKMEDCQDLIKQLGQYVTRNAPQNKFNKQKLKNLYKEYKEEYKGIRTFIPSIDCVIGTLGYKSLAILGACQGHGKSSLALTVTYNT